jgi:hypothetical protein
MCSPKDTPFFLNFPHPQFLLEREYTANSTHRHDYTPRISLGFIPLHTSTPLLDLEDQTSDLLSSDDFSLPTKQYEPSPQEAQYEPHGFIPLCSVAAVQHEDKDRDYFALPKRRSSLLGGWPGTVESSGRTASALIPSTTEDKQVPFDDLRHPTGSPLLEQDILPPPNEPPQKAVPRLRGGASLDLDEEVCEHEVLMKEVEEVLALWEESVTEYAPEEYKGYGASLSSTSSYSSDGACYGHDMHQEGTAKDVEDSSSDTDSCYSDTSNLIDETPHSDESSSAGSRPERAVSYATLKREYDPNSTSSASDITQSLERFSEVSPASSNEAIYPQPLLISSHNPHIDDKTSGASTILSPLFPINPITNFATPPSLRPPPHTPPTLYKLASQTPTPTLATLLLPPYTSLVNASTHETYIPSVPIRMLEHFCGVNAIEKLVPRYSASRDVLEIPDMAAEHSGIARVIRFMRRCCLPSTHTSCGDLRVPPSLREAIETVRACWVLGLQADAERIEGLIVRKWMAQPTWCMTVEQIELIWDGYFGSLRDTGFGDAVVWFVLVEAQNGMLTEEMRKMLELERYVGLDGRIESEKATGIWKGEDRNGFLDRCKTQREAQKDVVSKLRRARFLRSARSVEVDEPWPLRIEKKAQPKLSREAETDIKTRLEHGLPFDSGHAPASGIVKEISLSRAPSKPNITWADGVLPSLKRTLSFPIMPPSPGYTSLDAFENPREVPSLRKQRSLWDKLKTSV